MTRTVVIAPDSFKGSIGAAAAAEAVASGWREIDPSAELVLAPMADGGEGTLDAFAAAVPGAERIPVEVTGPADTPVAASWLRLPPTVEAPDGTGVVELASTSGIELLGDDLRPWEAHTLGFGQAVAAALDAGVSRLVLGIGSSASTDVGVGLLTALGGHVTDADGTPAPLGLRGLASAAAADLTGLRPLPTGGVLVLTDVTNPLLGPDGAAAVFGPQKGLTCADLGHADDLLRRFAGLVEMGPTDHGRLGRPAQERPEAGVEGFSTASPRHSGSPFHGADPGQPGTGAAGGTGFALAIWGARLVPGAPAVADLIGLEERIAGADLVITGEGSYDGQSGSGKAPAFVADLARRLGAPVALVAGRITPDADTTHLTAAISLTDLAGSPEAAMADPARWLARSGHTLAESADR